MNPFTPHVRHRGYFLETDPPDAEAGEGESAEGITVRLRIVKPLHKRVVVAARGANTRPVPGHRYGPNKRRPCSAQDRH